MSPTIDWPTNLSEEITTLIELFFSTLDSKSEQAGSQLVAKVFTDKGKFWSSSGYFEGRGMAVTFLPDFLFARVFVFIVMEFSDIVTIDIARSRDDIWDAFEVRSHELHKVFVNDNNGLDVFIVGSAAVKPHGGEQTEFEFIGRAIVEKTAKGPRLGFYQPIVPRPEQLPILAPVK